MVAASPDELLTIVAMTATASVSANATELNARPTLKVPEWQLLPMNFVCCWLVPLLTWMLNPT